MVDVTLIEKVKESTIWLEAQILGIQFPGTSRNRIAAALFSIALEQGIGIVYLIENSKYSPAFSLLRVTFESLVRGKWIQMAASEKFIDNFEQNKFPKLYTQIKHIEGKDSDIGKNILRFKNRTDDALHDYTHSGHRAISRRLSGSSIMPSYQSEEILEVLNLARSFSFIAATSLCDLANNDNISRKIYYHFKDLLPLLDSE